MKTKSVLVISYDEDDSAKLLMQRLNEIGQHYYLVDLSKYPNQATATLDYSSGSVESRFSGEGVTFNPKSIKSIWWRRPKGKVRPPTEDPITRYMEIESEILMNSFFELFRDVRWVSNPEMTRIANHKPLQLEFAQKIGFRIPKTIISNDPAAVTDFLRSNWDMPVIMKPVGTSFVRISPDVKNPGDKNLAIYTRIIDKKQILENIAMVANCPVIFQEAAGQEFDVRATVIGDKVFAIKIGHSEDFGAGSNNVDWRNQKLKRTYEKLIVPAEIENKCVEITQSLNLNMGAIDLCYSKKKGFTFLEINPQGQWVPSETVAGHPVSLTLAKFLSEC